MREALVSGGSLQSVRVEASMCIVVEFGERSVTDA